jgi:predicted RNA-binding Zn ribbon-like protein
VNFAFVSGHVALDFAGTLQHRRSASVDLLTSPDDLAGWTADAGLVDTPPPADEDALARAVSLREALYRLACSAREGTPYGARDRTLLNRVAAGEPVRKRLTAEGTVERVGDIDAALATVGREAVELLAGPLAAAIKECAAEDCTRLYVDTSRRGSRRWCDMRWCGNRAKAATFRARHIP